ncbi:MAG: methyl-accepting chemotaxis protein, partial [Deltaproteobacteria bacterium]|nr:methyl-accepting chemotaxis protein [Deltaproteobacteria bacterium]
MLKNMKIGIRLGLGFGLILLLLVVVGISGYWGINSVSGTIKTALQTDGNIAEHSARARANVLGLRRFEKDLYLNIGSPEKETEYQKKWNEQYEHLTARISGLEKVAVLQQDKDLIKTMKDELANYKVGFDKVLNLIQAGKIKTPQEANTAITEYKDVIHKMESAAKDYADEGNKRLDAAEVTVDSVAKKTTSVMMIFMAIAVILTITISIPLALSITRPINNIAALAKRTARDGDISYEIDIKRRDEIGDLADSFRDMFSYLKSMAHTAEAIAEGDLKGDVTPKSEKDTLGNAFKKMITGLRDIVGQLRGGSDQVASASSEIAATAEQSSRNSEGAATAVEEITSTIHEMSAN